tara:strand:- start:1374 stop:1655 length:282 start_codon:yes stop_codon:yes gene_type:complete
MAGLKNKIKKFKGAISDSEIKFIKKKYEKDLPKFKGAISDAERAFIIGITPGNTEDMREQGLKAFPGAISDGEKNFIKKGKSAAQRFKDRYGK